MNLKGIKLTWFGHATFRIETPGGKTVIVDPWVMGNPACPEKDKNVDHVDAMLCTHGHWIISPTPSISARSSILPWLASPSWQAGCKKKASSRSADE